MSKISKKKSERKFPFRDVTLCLNGELIDERDQAQKALNLVISQAQPQKRLRSSEVGVDERRRIEEIEDAMRDASVTIRITGVPFGDYNKMMAANPPREGHEELFNPGTFFLYVAKRTGQSVEDDGTLEEITPEEWEFIEATLTDGEHDRLASAVVQVNRTAGARGVDFLSRSSGATSSSDEISESPADLE